MLFAFPPWFFVLVAALVIGCCAAIIVLIVLLVRSLSKATPKEEEYEVDGVVRTVALLIDLAIVSVIISIISGLISIISTPNPIYLYYYFMSYLNPYQIIYVTMRIILSPVFFFIDLPLLYYPYVTTFNVFYVFNMFLPYLTSFLYFFIFDTFANGKTLGKMVFRVKSISARGRPVKYYEALLNSAGKSLFFIGDLLIGAIVFALRKTEGRSKQFRLTQQIADILVVRTPRNLKY